MQFISVEADSTSKHNVSAKPGNTSRRSRLVRIRMECCVECIPGGSVCYEADDVSRGAEDPEN